MLKIKIVEQCRYLLVFALLSLVGQNASPQYITPKITEATKKVKISNYETDYKFCEGLLAVKNLDTRKWGYINEQGEKVLDFVYTGCGYFHEGVAWVYKQKKELNKNAYIDENPWGLYIINKQGVETEMPNFKYFSKFVDGVAYVTLGNKSYYIDKNGKEVYKKLGFISIPPNLTPRAFSNGLSVLYDCKKGKCGFINREGIFKIPALYLYAKDFSEGLAAVLFEATDTSSSKWGFIDVSGSIVIPPIFNREPSSFSHGYAKVIKGDGTVVLINKSAKIVISDLINIYPFESGHAIARFKQDSYACFLDTNLNVIEKLNGLYLKGFKSLSEEYGIATPVHRTIQPWEISYNNFEIPFNEEEGCFIDNNGHLLFYLFKSSETSYGYTIDNLTTNLMHCATQLANRTIIDGFIDQNGIYQFIFSPEDF